ncbi:MAG: SPOR domain-containing protein [Alphaproteobacteria bacterium]|nr:SPOR domain-containing protein [Alphaproteobacteria bacterium]
MWENDKKEFDDNTPIPFSVDKEEDAVQEETGFFTASPYNFRAEYKEKITVPKTEELDESFSSIRFHAIGIGVLVGILVTVLVSVVFWGIADEKEMEPIIITASEEPVKVKPENPGGMRIPDQDKLVYKRLQTEDKDIKVEKVVPVPEAPVKPIVAEVPTAKPEVKPNVSEKKELEVISRQDKGVKTEVMPDPFAEVNQDTKVKTEEQKKETPQEEKQKATVSDLIKKVAGLNEDMWHVQLISLPSKETVEKNWPKILKEHAILLTGQPHDIVEVVIPKKGTFYRLRVGEFKTKEDAKSFCDKLKSRKQDCTVTK